MEWGIGMFKQYSTQGGLFTRTLTWAALAASTALTACGGGSSGAPSTAISGQVVKGPVDGAQVCAFQVVNNARGPALGSCVSTNAQGSYTLTVPVTSGPVWLEATGGTYTDEATGNPTALPTGTPMLSLVNATGGTAAAMVTPLTTLAVNTARQAAGAGAPVDETAVRQAVTQVLQQLSLPLGLDLLATAPVVGNGANDYGQALAAISKMVEQGTPLATVLTGNDAGSFSQAYATATAALQNGSEGGTGGNGGGNSGGNPGAAATPSASGSVTVGSGSFTPQANGFEVTVESNTGNEAKYRFFRTVQRVVNNVTLTDTQELVIEHSRSPNPSVPRYSYRFNDSTGALASAQCTANCDVVITATGNSAHPVSITIGGTDSTEPVRGTLTGDVNDAWWSFSDVPATTTGSLTRNGSAVTVRTASMEIFQGNASGNIELDDGRLLSVSRSSGQAPTASYHGGLFCFSNCGMTLDSADGVTTVTFQATQVGSNMTGFATFEGTVTVDRTRSTVSSSALGAFPATSDTLKSVNDIRTLKFINSELFAADIKSIEVTHRGGVVTRVDVLARQNNTLVTRTCGDGLSLSGVSPCSGITLGNDGRTVTFANTALYAGGLGAQVVVSATLDGTLVARGR